MATYPLTADETRAACAKFGITVKPAITKGEFRQLTRFKPDGIQANRVKRRMKRVEQLPQVSLELPPTSGYCSEQ